MSEVVLDASAVLAALFEEPGGDIVAARGQGARIAAPNYAEVLTKALDQGCPMEQTLAMIDTLSLAIIPFGTEEARLVASLRSATKGRGLSLADRACLALGLELGLPVLTADRHWKGLDVGVTIELIR